MIFTLLVRVKCNTAILLMYLCLHYSIHNGKVVFFFITSLNTDLIRDSIIKYNNTI